MFKNPFFKIIPFLLFAVFFNSCDKEFSVVGEEIIGNNSFGIIKDEFPVIAYNQKIDPVQSNNLNVNALGVYNNPSFGTTKATFVTQLIMATTNPTLPKEPKIKSVVLSIPYFSTKTATDASTGVSTYVLDSIYGPSQAKMKLNVYESDYFMRDLDPEQQLTQPQKYFSDQYDDFKGKIVGAALNNSATTSENTEFFFDAKEHSETTIVSGKTTITRSAPGMYLNLDANFFKTKIFNAPAGSLVDNATFKNYFRGLFFDIESNNGSGNLAMIDFKKGTITVTYTETAEATEEKKFVLNLTGVTGTTVNTVNLLTQSNPNSNYTNATDPANINKEKGDANLYLKGGEGSMAIVKLFGEDKFGEDGVTGIPNDVPDKLDYLRANECLINQAELTFYLNSSVMETSHVPQRIYLYDFDNYKVLADYTNDISVASNSKKNKFIFGGIIYKPTAGTNEGSYYKFRITEHIRSLVKNKTSKNVNLGLVVTEDINRSNVFYWLKDENGIPPKVPMASVMNPLGAIVYGNNVTDADAAKKLKFKIYYTKTN